jgi:hypothetical protein
MEKIKIESEEIVVVIRQSDSRTYAPCECGGSAEDKTDTGYITASELGRPSGAKGQDTWSAWTECTKCGKVTERGHWPRLPQWEVTIEDNWGNYLTSACSFSKEDAVRKASESYEDAANSGYLGDC